MEHQDKSPLRLLFVGDVMLGRQVNAVLRNQAPAYPWGDTLPLFQQADVRLCNLECVLSDHGTPRSATPKMFHFRSDAKNIAVLSAAHLDVVSLANNHVLDFEEEGLWHTIRTLQAAGIQHAGAGMTNAEAAAPALWEVKGSTLGLIALTDNEPDWEASADQPGIRYVPLTLEDRRALHLFDLVRHTKENVDLLIVSAHWGPNWGNEPPANQVPFAHALVAAGADVIFGHSAHVVRGIELYQGKPILYGTGDYIDDYAVDEIDRNDESGLFVVELERQGIAQLRFYPTMIAACQARRATATERKAIVARMQRLCGKLHTDTSWDEQAESLEIRVQK